MSEGLIGVADVHHDARARAPPGVEGYLLDTIFLDPGIDPPDVALGAAYRHLRAVLDRPGGVAAAHDRGNYQLARDDRGVAGAAPPGVGKSGGGLFSPAP